MCACACSDRRTAPDLRPYSVYKTKNAEYDIAAARAAGAHTRKLHASRVPAATLGAISPPLPPMYRRQYAVPASNTRFVNFFM